ncbi:microcystin-dependent protein [Ancylobacter aquaticus]|uniref:Microcystin-dependent protein n=1 Tax=Ancylobacter aquaticus TaxID=100 RepID=A0A4R1HZ05_ANCAQ|nr:tail fiber protein [Ancylobacter aquaticus]TCK28074.1 microcystin-dependent protein [Ancylobacter aquaticus]
MTDSFIGEIRAFAYNRVPNGWVPADGRILPTRQYQALYGLLGHSFGGNGDTDFALPDLRGRVPLGMGQDADPPNTPRPFASKGGAESVALTAETMPPHTHPLRASTAPGTTVSSKDACLATIGPDSEAHKERFLYRPLLGSNLIALNEAMVGPKGAGAAHNNMQPFAVVTYCICVTGVWPSKE